jgi:hypothetical protein
MKYKFLLCTIGLLACSLAAFSQITITGPTCVNAGVQYTYHLGGSWTPSTGTIWGASGGTIAGPTRGTPVTSVTVTWNSGVSSGSVSVSTTNPTASYNLPVTINTNGSPSVSITTPANTVCAGAPVTFTATPTNGGSAPAYQWMINGSTVSGATGSSFTTSSLSNVQIVTCAMTSSLACILPATATSNDEVMTVNPTQTMSVNIGSNVTVCQGGPANFTATVTNGAGTLTYQWKINGSSVTGATGSTFTTSSLSNGQVVSCAVTTNAPCYTPTAVSNSVTATIVSTQAFTISIGSGYAGQAVCLGQTVPFTSSASQAVASYQWYQNGTAVSGATSSTYSTTASSLAVLQGVSLVATPSGGCPSNPSATATSQSLAISITPTVGTPSAPSGPVSLYSGNVPVNYTTSATNATGYNWSLTPSAAGTISGSGATGTVTWNPAFTGGAVVSVTATGCNGPSAAASTSVTVTTLPDFNYIRERSIMKAGVTDLATGAALTSPAEVQQTTSYFDGVGRAVLMVTKQGSPLLQDMVAMHVYDPFGREATQYIPYTSPSGDGNYKPQALTEQNTFNAAQFPQDQFYYGQVAFEPSPLSRPLFTYAPGNSWVGSSRG